MADQARAAGKITSPSGTERLHQYWVHGEGAAKIRWGEPGDFDRCVLHLGKFIKDPKGYCNLAHHAALGYYPATHAAMEHGRADMGTQRAELASAAINDLPDSAFAYIEPGGTKDSSGKTTPRSKRHFPVHDKAHAANALSRAPQSPFGDKAMPKIRQACKKFGVQMADEPAPSGRADEGRADSLAPYRRSFPLEDISVRAGGDGRIVEAYAAVFDTRSKPIHDQDGDYTEELDPAVFNRAISDAAPQGSRRNWKIGVFYNHGMTISGAPSDRHSMPVGKILDIKADSRGLWTEVRYNRTQLADEVLENIREGSIPGYSFQGHFRRSSPLIPRGGFRKNYRTGELPHVRRMESTLLELGPTPLPVYEEAAVAGMRADQLLGAMAADPELAMRMIGMFSAGAHSDEGDSPADTGAPEPGLAAEDSRPQRVRSGRSIREQVQRNAALLLQGQHRR